MKLTPLRRLLSLVLAVLLCSTAGAVETEQVLLIGDKIQAKNTEFQEINGVPMIIKTFLLEPEADPEILREEPFAKDGYKFSYDHTDKTEQKKEDKIDAYETVAIDSSSGRLEDVISKFPGTRAYNKDGYTGTLTLDTESVNIEPTGYETVTDSYPHKVTKQFSLEYNDRSQVPETIEEDGISLPLVSLDWAEGEVTEGSDIPAGWIATAVYSKTTYTNRQVVTGYKATAKYRGQVVKTSVDKIQYTLTYTGTEIPVIPGLPLMLANEQQVQSDTDVTEIIAILIVFLIMLFVIYLIKSSTQKRTAHVYVYGKFDNLLYSSRYCFSVKKPIISIPDFKGETVECVVLLHKRMAKKLSGQKVYVQSSDRSEYHIVQPFVSGNYIFRVVFPGTSEINLLE